MLLDFLKDSQTCVLNGRFRPEKDNYTDIDPKRHSIINHAIVHYTELEKVFYVGI